MYNLLIVDDEKLSVEGMYEFLKNESIPDLNLYTSYNAIQALALMDRLKIDIILLDINMPGMSGLEMLTEVNKRWPRCKIIFLTGYNEFDYVQTAIRGISLDYILKTEGDEVVLAAVEKAIKQLDEDLDKEKLLSQATEALQLTLPILGQQYLLGLLNGEEILPSMLEIEFSELGISLSPKADVILLLGLIDKIDQSDGYREKNRKFLTIRNIVAEFLGYQVKLEYIPYRKNRFAFFIQPETVITETYTPEKGWTYIRALIDGSIESIQNKCLELTGITVSFVSTPSLCSWRELQVYFEKLDSLFDKNSCSGPAMILTTISSIYHESELSEPLIKEEDLAEVRALLKKLVLLELALDDNYINQINSRLDELRDLIRSKGRLPQGIRLEIHHTLAKTFLSYLNKREIYEKVHSRFDLNNLSMVDPLISDDEILLFYKELAEIACSRQAEEQCHYTNKVITTLQDYINEHIDGDLSINKLADVTHFNPSYLSRLFKNYTGTSVSEYIWKLKLQKAREILLDNNTKINEIAARLGFESPAYFTRFFKKYTDLTPQEFRSMKG